MILRHFRIFAHSSAHTPRTSAGFAPHSGVQAPARLRTARRVGLLLALLFALLLGTLPLNARLVLRHGDQVLSPADTVRITVVEQRTEYPSDDPANPDPFTVVDFKYPDLASYTVGTDEPLTAPLDFSALVENVSDFSLQWCGLTHECNFLSARGDRETRNARLTAEKPRLPLELEGHFEANHYGHAVARLTLTPTAAAATATSAATTAATSATTAAASVTPATAETSAPVIYTIRFTYPAPSALRRVATPLPADAVLYDLAGRRVLRPRPGHIYLRAGRKFVAE